MELVLSSEVTGPQVGALIAVRYPMDEINEVVWQAWLHKCQVNERRRAAFRWKVTKWVAGLGLLIGVALYSGQMPNAAAVRCLVAVGAVVAVFKALRPRVSGRSLKQGV